MWLYSDSVASENHNLEDNFSNTIFADYPAYRRQQLRERINTDEYNAIENDYEQNFNEREDYPRGRLEDSEWFFNENEYEHNRDDRNLRLSLSGDDTRYDRRGLNKLPSRGGPLPPEVPQNWDQINVGKHKGTTESPHVDPEQLNRAHHQAEYDHYDDLKARRHIRQHEESSNSVHSVGSIHDSSQGSKNFLVAENNQYDKSIQLRDSVKHNTELSSKKSDVFHSDEHSGMMSVGSEKALDDKKIPPVPLSRETASVPDDNSGLPGNHMQTEKEAFAEEGANTKSEGKVMVKGQVKQVKADIDQGPNPEKTYKRVEDFFQTQRESSIVEVPNAVKKEEASKLFKDNFIPVKEDGSDQVNKEQGKNSFLSWVINIEFS